MSAQLDALRGKVQGILTEQFGSVQVDKDGDFAMQHESAHAFVRCSNFGEDKTRVTVFALVLTGVDKSAALNEYIAYHADDYVFGHLFLTDHGDTCDIMISHILLGDYLDAEELLYAVGGVLSTANSLDDELQKKFGGKRFHEDA